MIRNYFIIVILCMTVLVCTKLQEPKIQRYGRIVAIKPGKIDEFKKLHESVRPEVLAELRKSNICNYSIYLKELEEGKPYLFKYFEYIGDDFDADMTQIRNNPKIQQWEKMAGEEWFVEQSPDKKKDWWIDMEEVFYFNGKANSGIDESKVQRIGMVIGLQPEMKEAYVLLHKNIWPEVQSKITEGNIRNYAIYLHELDCKFYLFSYFEYVGNNFPADMELIDNDPATIAWMKFTDTGCQLPISTRSEGEWWAAMEQVFYSK